MLISIILSKKFFVHDMNSKDIIIVHKVNDKTVSYTHGYTTKTKNVLSVCTISSVSKKNVYLMHK